MPPKRGRYVAHDTAQVAQDASATARLVSLTASILDTTASAPTMEVPTPSPSEELTAPPSFTVPRALQARLAALKQPAAHARLPAEEVEMETAPTRAGTHRTAKRPRAAQAKAEDEEEDGATSVVTSRRTTAATNAKPLILSRRWRSQLAPATRTSTAVTHGDPSTAGEFFSNSGDDVIRFDSRPAGAVSSLSQASSSDGESGVSSSSNSEAGEDERKEETAQERHRRKQRDERRRRLFDRHVEDYEEGALRAQEAALRDQLEDEDDDDEATDVDSAHYGEEAEEEEEVEEGSTDEPDDMAAKSDVHSILRQRAQGAGPQRFGSLYFSNYIDESSVAASLSRARRQTADGEAADEAGGEDGAVFPCYHTLIGVNDPVTIQGPCGVVGLGLGEASVGGYYVGHKQLGLWNPLQKAVVTPVRPLKSKAAQRSETTRWGRGRAYKLNADGACVDGADDTVKGTCLTPVDAKRWKKEKEAGQSPSQPPQEAGEAAEEDDEDMIINMDLSDVEALFGVMDWAWVEKEVAYWKTYFATRRMPSTVLLVVRPYEPGRTFLRRHYLQARRTRMSSFLEQAEAAEKSRYGTHNQSDAFVEIPSFVAKTAAQQIDVALLPEVMPAIVSRGSGSVVVIGSANIGKSTLCRFLCNGFLSQHGVCYWLDMDLGQPEFGVPGQLSLYCVRQPLFRSGDELHCAELVQALFLGSSTVRCPASMANAIAAMCALVEQVQREHPVVVNTHGWVLQTGRRTTTEVIQRLRPRHVIHLLKPKEIAWARETEALMSPVNGLNAHVLSNRFRARLYTWPSATGAGQSSTKEKKRTSKHASPTHREDGTLVGVLGRLPYPLVDKDRPKSGGGSRPHQSPSPHTRVWDGEVHTVFVERSTSAAERQALAKEKGSRGRQARWHGYFVPVLRTYQEEQDAEPSQSEEAGDEPPRCRPFGTNHHHHPLADQLRGKLQHSPHTTRLRAPLSTLRGLVIAELDERVTSLPLRHVAALLERGVVAVQFYCPTAPPSSSSPSIVELSDDGSVSVRVSSLTALTTGFPVSCYAVVESTEDAWHTWETALAEARGDGDGPRAEEGPVLTLHIPLAPAAVRALLAQCADAHGGLVIAYSAQLREDTAFLEEYA